MLQRISTFQTLAVILLFGLFINPTAADTLVVDDFIFLGSSDVVDDVLILQGGVLLMDGTTVAGDIEVEHGGALAASRTIVEGNVRAEQAMLIDLGFCDIGGNVELKRTGGIGAVFGILPSISLLNCDVLGNVKITRSDVNSINVSFNRINHKLELSRNRSSLPIVVENNVVGRDACD